MMSGGSAAGHHQASPLSLFSKQADCQDTAGACASRIVLGDLGPGPADGFTQAGDVFADAGVLVVD
jgi:hypothetical protein